ncbi:MAG: succinate dehydrogenase, partial [Dehalococcoidia bacterium]
KERLRALSQATGIWDCTHCFECVEVCPKGVAPMDRIMQLREKAVAAGFTNNHGTRHAQAFAESVSKYGRLDEVMLVPKSVGMFNVGELVPQAPTALRMLRAGKLRFPHKAENREKIRRVFAKLEKK